MTLAVNLAQGASNNVTFRNRIINGAMVLDQRNAGASVTPAGSANTYTLDRYGIYCSQSSKLTVQQSTTAPTGFTNSYLVTSSSAYSVTSSDEFNITQPIEGFNFSDMAWGTANAQTITLSFWVRSSLTGTFGGALRNSSLARNYPFSYTISTANTFEYKTITIAGDTSGTWVGATNGIGVYVGFSVGAGSSASGTAGAWAAGNKISATGAVSVVGTNGATFYITGVQLEAGTTASPFEYRQYGTELQLCQRYFWRMSGVSGGNNTIASAMVNASTDVRAVLTHPVPMRTTVSVSITGTNYGYSNAGSVKTLATINAADQTPQTVLLYSGAGTTSATVGQAAQYVITNVDSYISVSAEL